MERTRGHAETSNIPDYGHNIQPATALGQVMGRRFPLMPSDWVFGFIYFPLPVALDSLRKYHWLAAPFCFPKCSGKSPHELCLSAYKLSTPRKKPQTARSPAALLQSAATRRGFTLAGDTHQHQHLLTLSFWMQSLRLGNNVCKPSSPNTGTKCTTQVRKSVNLISI